MRDRKGCLAELMLKEEVCQKLEDYMDLRDDLNNVLNNLTGLQDDVATAMEDIKIELDSLETQLYSIGRSLKRLKTRQCGTFKEQDDCELPFDDEGKARLFY